jgi:hypothetical protein
MSDSDEGIDEAKDGRDRPLPKDLDDCSGILCVAHDPVVNRCGYLRAIELRIPA